MTAGPKALAVADGDEFAKEAGAESVPPPSGGGSDLQRAVARWSHPLTQVVLTPLRM